MDRLQELINKISKEELESYYKTHRIMDTAKYFHTSYPYIRKLIDFYGIVKTKEDIEKERLETRLNKYGSLENYKEVRNTKMNDSIIEKYGSLEAYNKLRIDKMLETKLEKYGDINYSNREKARKTTKEHYGVEFPLQSDKCQENRRNTLKERYGVDKYNNREKSIQTCLEKYGVENPAKTKEVIEKIKDSCAKKFGSYENYVKCNLEKATNTKLEKYGDKYYNNIDKRRQTNLERYGHICYLASEEGRKKVREILRKKYGVDYISQSNVIKEKVSNTCQDRYNVPFACMRKEARFKGNDSRINREFSELLSKNNISFEREFPLNNKSYDFKIDNVLVEINPASTHNSTFGIFATEGLPKNYHCDKSKLARENNFRCIHVWDWDDTNKIIKMLLPKSKLYARNCVVEEVSKFDCDSFLNTYHLQNTCKNQSVRLGLYFNNELVQIMTFGSPRYTKRYQWELLRLCTKNDYIVVGGAEKLFKFFIDNYNPESIISYCDMSKFNGNIYEKLGFIKQKEAPPSKHWYNPYKHQHITDNLLRQRGFDQLFNTNYGKGTSNEELMKNAKFVEIYDCGQNTYSYRK